jgi:2-polyprenyl-6-methoxyphenol hydroxylase-like FAD-dependent oxidoreductase
MSGLFTAALLRRVGWEVFTPIYDLASPRMVLGRVVLIGDAASVGRPHMGFGVSKAAEDARALADALGAHGADIDAELAQFEGVRRPIGERVMLHGRKLGAHLGVNLKTEDEWAMWKLLQDPHAVLGHIAVPHFLAA